MSDTFRRYGGRCQIFTGNRAPFGGQMTSDFIVSVIESVDRARPGILSLASRESLSRLPRGPSSFMTIFAGPRQNIYRRGNFERCAFENASFNLVNHCVHCLPFVNEHNISHRHNAFRSATPPIFRAASSQVSRLQACTRPWNTIRCSRWSAVSPLVPFLSLLSSSRSV